MTDRLVLIVGAGSTGLVLALRLTRRGVRVRIVVRRAGLRPAALYLVRPDGYVALADPRAGPERLRAHMERIKEFNTTDS